MLNSVKLLKSATKYKKKYTFCFTESAHKNNILSVIYHKSRTCTFFRHRLDRRAADLTVTVLL